MSGRKRLSEPSNKHAAILEALSDGNRPATVARVYNMSRQSVRSIASRWPDFLPKHRQNRKGLSRAKNR